MPLPPPFFPSPPESGNKARGTPLRPVRPPVHDKPPRIQKGRTDLRSGRKRVIPPRIWADEPGRSPSNRGSSDRGSLGSYPFPLKGIPPGFPNRHGQRQLPSALPVLSTQR